MANNNASLGKASLWSAIIGFVLPVSLAVLVAIFVKENQQALPYALCGFLFVGLELVALGCGMAAGRMTNSKAGLVISGVLLSSVAITIPLLLIGVGIRLLFVLVLGGLVAFWVLSQERPHESKPWNEAGP
jgi:heme/copper-type cytochrome/quinol oxidase subunit 4